MPSATAQVTPPDTPSGQPVRVLGGSADAAAAGRSNGEREVLVRKDAKAKGYQAVPTVEREEEVDGEADDVEGKVVIRVR